MWGFAKRYTRDNCGYSLVAIRRVVPEGLASIPVYLARRFYNKSTRYLDIYEALFCSAPLADLVCRVYRSHRRVCDNTVHGAIRKAAETSPLYKDSLLALLDDQGVSQSIFALSCQGRQGGGEGDHCEDDDQASLTDIDDDDEWETVH